MPEGYTWVSAKDLRGENVVNIIFSDWPVFAAGEVNFIGESIGIFVGKINTLQKLTEFRFQHPLQLR